MKSIRQKQAKHSLSLSQQGESEPMMMMSSSSKVLACYLVLVVLSSLAKRGLGIYIYPDCLMRICLADTSPCGSSSPAGIELRVSEQADLSNINALLERQPPPESGFYCSNLDVLRFTRLIKCNCNLSFPDNGTCRVTYIDFSYMDLKGEMPPSIGNLTYLKYLDLSGNRLTGLIPTSLVELRQLLFVDLNHNLLEGPVPLFNGSNSELRSLNLCANRLNGFIPKEFGELQSLQNLHLCFNSLNGTIPDELWNITSLVSIEFQDNHLEGQIPEQLGTLLNVEEIVLMNNDFSGVLPNSTTALKNLVSLRLQGSKFNGRIPDAITQLPNLVTLWLIGNNFTGPLPGTISSRSLSEIVISDLYPDENGNPFPHLGELMNLRSLTLRNCSLIGPIPSEVWTLQNLIYLDLSFNNLGGEVPPSLSGKKLTTIYLRSNRLNGLLPGWASNSTAVVDVSDNLFTRNVIFPNVSAFQDKNLFACCSNASDDDSSRNWLDINYQCSNETSTRNHLFINCGGNATFINGSYYEADMDLDGRSTFYLSNNSNWGYSSIGSFVLSTKKQYIVNRTCDISLVDGPLYTEARVAPISLKYYGFCLKNDNYTVRLHFAEIGWDAAKVRSRRRRRLFNIDIQGKKELEDFSIEEEAGGMYQNATKEFNTSVTNNRLEIHFYWSGKGSVFVPKQYGPLISAISVSPVPKKHHKLSPVSVGAIAGSSVVFVALVLASFWMLGWLHPKKPKRDGVYTFEEIKDATKNFDRENQIGGRGAVFKGKLEDGTEIAVKVLSAESKQDAAQMIQEIGLINTLDEHENIAKPMGSCRKDRKVLLVYKYMENISLQHALFDSSEVKSKLQSWEIRSKICRGIAKGLNFLHEESKLDIIHSNIKPTNILLDKDFNVKISDFRYSELHDGQLKKEEATSLRNMPRAKDTGHMAPEYMQGSRLTTKADVYSFGLVMLEIISGQPLITRKTREDVLLIDTASKYYGQGIPEALIDEALKSKDDYKHHEAISMLHLATNCLSLSPNSRLSISEVVQILESKKKFKGKGTNPLAMVEPVVSPSQSTESGSTSLEGASSTNISNSQNEKPEDSILSTD